VEDDGTVSTTTVTPKTETSEDSVTRSVLFGPAQGAGAP